MFSVLDLGITVGRSGQRTTFALCRFEIGCFARNSLHCNGNILQGDPSIRQRRAHRYGTRFEVLACIWKSSRSPLTETRNRCEDLKLEDFIGVKTMSQQKIQPKNVVKSVADAFKTGTPFVRFLCKANEVRSAGPSGVAASPSSHPDQLFPLIFIDFASTH